MRTKDTGREITHCFASVVRDTIIDVINPDTGLSAINRKNLDDCRKEYPDAELMTIQAWCENKAARQDTPIELQSTTQEQYWEMLEVLPPAFMALGCFLVGEAMDHHALTGQPRYSAYFQVGNHYSVANRPLTVLEMKRLLSVRSAKFAAEVAEASEQTILGNKVGRQE